MTRPSAKNLDFFAILEDMNMFLKEKHMSYHQGPYKPLGQTNFEPFGMFEPVGPLSIHPFSKRKLLLFFGVEV